jgi:hypothetical protein
MGRSTPNHNEGLSLTQVNKVSNIAQVVGYLFSGAPQGGAVDTAAAFRKGLSEAGYVDGKASRSNTVGGKVVTIDCPRWRPSSCAVG